jgi:ATP-dependent helicase/nuclease subunit A
MRAEIVTQADECAGAASELLAGPAVGHFYANQIVEYAQQLRSWAARLPVELPSVRNEIHDFEFSRKSGPRLTDDVSETLRAARDAASARWSAIKKTLFGERLKNRFALFSLEEWTAGLKKTAPYLRTLAELLAEFQAAHTVRKRRMNVLDFSDLERMAHELLTDRDDPTQSSATARAVRRQFAHVLVDEFQDINPIQQAIIERVSRCADDSEAGNLFTVGDVKQSIYRFRLAEPRLFTDRLKRCLEKAIFLQSNFRSRKEILDGVNLVFRHLMRADTGDVLFDSAAELTAARTFERELRHEPVEVHLLERAAGETENDDGTEADETSRNDPALWTPIEREACFIGSKIREWAGTERFQSLGRPLRYKDIVVLLRATRVNAEQVSTRLTAKGNPAFAEAGGS